MDSKKGQEKNKKSKQQDKNLDDLLNSSLDPKEVQQNELQIVQAICQDEFEMLTKNKFQIVVKPFPDEEENFVAVRMIVTMHAMYPFVEPPLIKIVNVKDQTLNGLSENQLSEIHKKITERANELVGQQMIFQLYLEVQEYLQQNNKQQMSFYDEMVESQKEQQIKSQQEQSKKHTEKENEEKRGQEELDKLIEEELTRQRLLPPETRELESSIDDIAEDSWKFLSDDKFKNLGIEKTARETLNFSTNDLTKFLKTPPLNSVRAPFKWEKKADLGKGTYGTIYSAENLSNNLQMFVKEVKIFSNDPEIEDKKDIIRKVMLSLDTLKTFTHENIVPYLGYELEVKSEYTILRIFQEHVGHDVTGVRIDWDEGVLKKIVLQIISGLNYLHSQDIPHLDLKSSNILFDNEGRARLTDFYISSDLKRLIDEEPLEEHLMDIRLNSSGTLSRSPFEPEYPLAQNELASQKTLDVWALGSTLLDMAEGRSFTAKKLPEELSKEGKDFLETCLRKNQKTTTLEVSSLLTHPWLSDISATFPEFIPKSPPPAPFPIPSSRSLQQPDDQSSISEISSRMAESSDSFGFPSANESSSRYKNDFVFEEEELLGSGGFGVVVKSKNKLDGRFYAIKKVPLHKHESYLQKMLREVTTLSRLNHQYVVRYYQAWIEKEDKSHPILNSEEEEEEEEEEESRSYGDDLDWSDEEFNLRKAKVSRSKSFSKASKSQSKSQTRKAKQEIEESSSSDTDPEDIESWFMPTNDWGLSALPQKSKFDESEDSIIFENNEDTFGFQDSTLNELEDSKAISTLKNNNLRLVLYIQMDYCTKNNLRQAIDDCLLDEDERWRLLREITEGLNHIHSQGIIHRDLKPANIFLDSNGSVKIGDFGLATTTATVIVGEDLILNDKERTKNSTRIGVGTPFYLAPEQEKCGTFDNKIDIFALGIIFFEMVQHFSTGMERASALNALRKEGKFPSDFHLKHTNEMDLIKWLLKPDPKERPSCTELLQSSLMPTRMDEELLKGAINNLDPTTTLFSTVIQKLFSFNPEKHLDYTYDYHITGTGQQYNLSENRIRFEVFDEVLSIGKKHGGVQVDTPMLIPKNDKAHHERSAYLLDDVGKLLALPYDLTFPFARFIVRNKITNLRRISIGRVYRKHDSKGKPRELYEADFDIITPLSAAHAQTMVCDAEVIKVTCETLDYFEKQIGQYFIRLNHAKLFDAILNVCEVDSKHSTVIRQAVNSILPNSWTRICQQLIRSKIIGEETAKALSLYFHTISNLGMSTALSKLESLLKRSRIAREALQELKHLFKHLKTWGVLSKVKLDLAFLLNPSYYDGIIFQAIIDNNQTNPDLIAAGGRYDRLIGHCSAHAPTLTVNCGVSIAIEKIVQYSSAFKQKLAKASGVKPPLNDTQVLVCSIGRNMLEYRMQVAHRLWQADIRAEYLHSDRLKVDELANQCKKMSIPWMVILKSTNFLSTETITLRDVKKGTDKVLDLDEMCTDLQQILFNQTLTIVPSVTTTVKLSTSNSPTLGVIAPKEQIDTRLLSTNQPAHGAPPEKTSTASKKHVSFTEPSLTKPTTNITTSTTNINVIVLSLDNNLQSKVKKKIAQSATQRILPNLKRFSTTAVIKVAAVDFPTPALKEIHSHYDYHTGRIDLVPKNPRFRDKLGLLQDFLKKEKQSPSPFCYVYSYQDDYFEVFLL